MNLTPEAFKKFIIKKHIKNCNDCQTDGGKRAIQDDRAVMLAWYRSFYEEQKDK